AEDADELYRRQERLQRGGGFLAATVEPRRLDRAARPLAARLNAVFIDLDAELLAAMRQAAEAAGADWRVILDADSAPRTDPRFRALQRLVDRAIPTLDRRVREADTLAVATDAGLLARYGRLDLLERLRDDLTRTEPTDGTTLTGLVVVVPSSDRDQPPVIDGTPIPNRDRDLITLG